jgi:hypothetical protein
MKLNSLIPTFLAATGVTLVANTMPAQAFLLDIDQKTSNSGLGLNYSSGIDIDVSSYGTNSNQVLFTFTNKGYTADPDGFSITNIYFGQKDSFSDYLNFSGTFIDQEGVSYSYESPKGQGNVGGGIDWKAAFLADPDAPAGYQGNGIDTGESLGIVFNLVGTTTFGDVENGFQGNESPLAIAMHLQSTVEGINPSKGSEWVATNGVTQEDIENIPEPFTILGTAMAFGFSGLCKGEYDKKKKKQKVTT